MDVSPKRGVYYHQLGLIRYRQQQWRPALQFFKQALEFGAGTYEAAVWRSIGDVQVELFDREAALQAYETALRIQPNDAPTRLALGRFYLERSKPDQAIQHLRAALEIDPMLRAAYPVLGRAYRQTGNLPAAQAILRKAVEANPSDQESRYALGQVFLAMGRADEGKKELDTYEEIRQQVAAANNNYEAALSHIEAGRFFEAEMLLRETVRLAPRYGPALHSLGTLLLDRGSPEKASDLLKRAVEETPLNSERGQTDEILWESPAPFGRRSAGSGDILIVFGRGCISRIRGCGGKGWRNSDEHLRRSFQRLHCRGEWERRRVFGLRQRR